jgi:hypothetical protein
VSIAPTGAKVPGDEREEGDVSEVIPEDEDRGGDGAMEGALADDPEDEEQEGGTGADDGGPGSQNM